jgi:hypothetical protein
MEITILCNQTECIHNLAFPHRVDRDNICTHPCPSIPGKDKGGSGRVCLSKSAQVQNVTKIMANACMGCGKEIPKEDVYCPECRTKK